MANGAVAKSRLCASAKLHSKRVDGMIMSDCQRGGQRGLRYVDLTAWRQPRGLGARCAPDSQILGGRRSPSPWISADAAISVMSNTSDDILGRSTTDTSGVGTANSAPPPGKAIVQSGIVAQFFGGQGDPSAISIMGAALKVTDVAARCAGAPISATRRRSTPTRCATILMISPFHGFKWFWQYTCC